MDRTDIINKLAKQINAQSYLEIGVRIASYNFNKVNIKNKIGVDPGIEGYNEATHVMTSDEFFEKNDQFFDIVFIDGLHEENQVKLDIKNSLKFLNSNGYIICHDMNPLIEEHQLSKTDDRRNSYVTKEKEKGNRAYGIWNGDCWKAWVKLRNTRKDLEMFVVDTDYGCGVIKKGIQETLNVSENDITFSNLEKNRKKWLNLIDIQEFLKKMS
jgi:hypothetical protein